MSTAPSHFTGSIFRDSCPLTLTPAQLYSLDPTTVTVLDASWHMPGSPRNPRADWLAAHIPGARYFDLDEVASPHELGLKHMIPSPEVFANACKSMGITPDSHVVIYDTHGIFSSPRALFTFRAFGHVRSSILDGGLPGWVAHGCPTEYGERASPFESATAEEVTYPVPELIVSVVKSYEQVVFNSQFDPAHEPLADIVLDARSYERYLGTAPEPRPGLSSGHIPYAYSLPFNTFLSMWPMPERIPVTSIPVPAGSAAPRLGDTAPLFEGVEVHTGSGKIKRPSSSPHSQSAIIEKDLEDKEFPIPLPASYATLKTTTQIVDILNETLGPRFAKDVLEGKRGVVASCGSGMTAGVLWLGLQAVGVANAGIYDESWTGYAMRKESKIVKGEEKRS